MKDKLNIYDHEKSILFKRGGVTPHEYSVECFLYLRSLSLGKIFSSRHIEILFFIIPRKQILQFHANYLHWGQFAWNIQYLEC